MVLEVEEAASRSRRSALAALCAGCSGAAYEHAGQACGLHRSPESVRVLALSALARGSFHEALALWRESGAS